MSKTFSPKKIFFLVLELSETCKNAIKNFGLSIYIYIYKDEEFFTKYGVRAFLTRAANSVKYAIS